jgi:hypothetical protein
MYTLTLNRNHCEERGVDVYAAYTPEVGRKIIFSLIIRSHCL